MTLAYRLLLICLIAVTLFCSIVLVRQADQQRILKQDIAELHHIRHGMLNPDNWTRQITDIITRKIIDFSINEENKAELSAFITQLLTTAIDQFEEFIALQAHQNNDRKWYKRWTDSMSFMLQNMVINFDGLRSKVPTYTEHILAELHKEEVRQQVATIVSEVVKQAQEAMFSPTDHAWQERIQQRYQCHTEADCHQQIKTQIDTHSVQNKWLLAAVLLSAVISFLLVWLKLKLAQKTPNKDTLNTQTAQPEPWGLAALGIISSILLVAGIFSPMIEIQASLAQMQMTFMGEPIVFNNQLIFYQNKSIYDVVSILIASLEPDMILVACLLVTFSIIFPTLKLISGALYYCQPKQRNNAFIRFFALFSGKWSMADVFVMAIFMAYIAFDSIIDNQLDNLAQASPNISTITGNGTSLQPGFILFTAFVLMSMAISALLHKLLLADFKPQLPDVKPQA